MAADGFDKRTDLGRRSFPADPRFWEGALATCTWSNGEIESLIIHPVTLGHGEPRPRRGRPALVVGEAGRRIIERIGRLSEPYGVEMSWNEEDCRGLVQLSATAG